MPKLHEKYLEEFDRHAPCDDTPGAPNIIATVRTNLKPPVLSRVKFEIYRNSLALRIIECKLVE